MRTSAGGEIPGVSSVCSQVESARSRSSGSSAANMFSGPLSRRVRRTSRRRPGCCTSPTPSAAITQIASETLDTNARSRSSDERTASSASNVSVTSRAFTTTPCTAGSSSRLVADISIQRSSPSARGERNVMRSVDRGVGAQPLERVAHRPEVVVGEREELAGRSLQESSTRRDPTKSAARGLT